MGRVLLPADFGTCRRAHLLHHALVRLLRLVARERAIDSAIGKRVRHRLLAGAEALLVTVNVEQAHVFQKLSAGRRHALDETLVGDVLVDDERDVHRHCGERGHVDVVARRTRRTLERLVQCMTSAGGKLLEDVRLFDVYRDEKRLGAGKKSMAYALTYRAADRTLTSDEAEKAHERMVKKVCSATGAEVRG